MPQIKNEESLKKLAEEIFEEVVEFLKDRGVVSMYELYRELGLSQILTRKLVVALCGIDVIVVKLRGKMYTISLNNNVNLEEKKKEFVEKFYWMFWYLE